MIPTMYIESEGPDGIIYTPIKEQLRYCKRNNPSAYVDMVEGFEKLGCAIAPPIPPEAKTLEQISQETKCLKFRVLNVLSMQAYLVWGVPSQGTGPLEGLTFWVAVYIDSGHKTFAVANRRMFVLLSTEEELAVYRCQHWGVNV